MAAPRPALGDLAGDRGEGSGASAFIPEKERRGAVGSIRRTSVLSTPDLGRDLRHLLPQQPDVERRVLHLARGPLARLDAAQPRPASPAGPRRSPRSIRRRPARPSCPPTTSRCRACGADGGGRPAHRALHRPPAHRALHRPSHRTARERGARARERARAPANGRARARAAKASGRRERVSPLARARARPERAPRHGLARARRACRASWCFYPRSRARSPL